MPLPASGTTGSDINHRVLVHHNGEPHRRPRAQPWTVSGAVGSALHDKLHDHGDAFPNLAEIPAHEVLPDSSWELGLRLLLDGLQTKIDMLIAS